MNDATQTITRAFVKMQRINLAAELRVRRSLAAPTLRIALGRVWSAHGVA